MNKTSLVFLGLLLYTSFSFAQTQHLDGPTKLINPRGRTLLIERDDEDSWLTFHDPRNRWYSMGIDKSNAGGVFSLNYGGTLTSTQFVMTTGGNIGIGTPSPQAKLHVNGRTLTKSLSLNGSNATPSANFFENVLEIKGLIHAAIVYNPGEDKELMFGFHSNGNFYWGTGRSATNPNYYSMFLNGSNGDLGIKGKLTANEIKVKIGGWADFVFADDYVLPPLSEVEQHIRLNKHLPAIPSEAEVLERGIELGVMNAKLLQKIEELTLYTIQQQKELSLEQKKNKEQQELILQLVSRMEKLEQE